MKFFFALRAITCASLIVNSLNNEAQAHNSMSQIPTFTVSAKDLDLTMDAGVKRLRSRVRYAAEQVCGDYPRFGLLLPAEIQRCRANAVRMADASIAAIVASKRQRLLAAVQPAR
jgi:UrcA family protein